MTHNENRVFAGRTVYGKFLRVILPFILPDNLRLDENCFLRPHNGKSHLQKSIPRKMEAFSKNTHELVKIIIVHDQDTNDCLKLKKELKTLCEQHGTCPFLIRIACRELEAWYLGDMPAIEKAYPNFKAKKYITKAKFRNPDNCNSSYELEKLLPNFQKGFASKEIPKYLDINNNRSESFNQFIKGIKSFLKTNN